MSFSSEVRDELEGRIGSARHCRLAEMQAIFIAGGGAFSEGAITFGCSNRQAERKFFTILGKAFNIDADCQPGKITGDAEALRDVCLAVKRHAVRNACCRRAWLRGAFLSTGTVSDPAKAYQLEFVCRTENLAGAIEDALSGEDIRSGRTKRNGRYVVWLRDGESIASLLGCMEAGRALLRMENERIVRDVRGHVNRRVNLEAANLGKAAEASARQIEAIRRLLEREEEDALPASLREIAELRLANPEATLQELGAMLHPPVGKSGVNHRLRRIMEMAGVDE